MSNNITEMMEEDDYSCWDPEQLAEQILAEDNALFPTDLSSSGTEGFGCQGGNDDSVSVATFPLEVQGYDFKAQYWCNEPVSPSSSQTSPTAEESNSSDGSVDERKPAAKDVGAASLNGMNQFEALRLPFSTNDFGCQLPPTVVNSNTLHESLDEKTPAVGASCFDELHRHEILKNGTNVTDKTPAVCFGWFKHPGTETGRNIVYELASSNSQRPENIAELVLQRLHEEGIYEILICVGKEDNTPLKNRVWDENGGDLFTWRTATFKEFEDRTKQWFTDAQKKRRRQDPPNLNGSSPKHPKNVVREPCYPIMEMAVCLEWWRHPGTIKWLEVLKTFSDNEEHFPEWSDIVTELVKESLAKENLTTFLVFRNAKEKPCTSIHDGLWVIANQDEIVEATKKQFRLNRRSAKEAQLIKGLKKPPPPNSGGSNPSSPEEWTSHDSSPSGNSSSGTSGSRSSPSPTNNSSSSAAREEEEVYTSSRQATDSASVVRMELPRPTVEFTDDDNAGRPPPDVSLNESFLPIEEVSKTYTHSSSTQSRNTQRSGWLSSWHPSLLSPALCLDAPEMETDECDGWCPTDECDGGRPTFPSISQIDLERLGIISGIEHTDSIRRVPIPYFQLESEYPDCISLPSCGKIELIVPDVPSFRIATKRKLGFRRFLSASTSGRRSMKKASMTKEGMEDQYLIDGLLNLDLKSRDPNAPDASDSNAPQVPDASAPNAADPQAPDRAQSSGERRQRIRLWSKLGFGKR